MHLTRRSFLGSDAQGPTVQNRLAQHMGAGRGERTDSMPDFITHSLEADRLLGEGGMQQELKTALGGYPNLFRLGSQGPDLLFYCAVAGGGTEMGKLGQRLHGMRCELPLGLAEERLKSGDAVSAAYLYGWALHLMLDGCAHPYIEKRAAETSGATGMDEGAAHVRFESAFEALQMQKETGVTPRRFAWRRDLPQDDGQRRCVISCNEQLCRVFGEQPPDAALFERTIKRLPLLFRIMFDRSGFFCTVARAVGALQKHPSATLWHVKRPYHLYPDGVLTDADIGTLEHAAVECAALFRRETGQRLRGIDAPPGAQTAADPLGTRG